MTAMIETTTPWSMPRLAAKARILCALGGFGWFGIAVYGSFLPFRWRDLTWGEAFERFAEIPMLDLGPGHRADWVANILLYIPGALLLAAAFLRAGEPAPARIAKLALLFAFGLTLAVAVEFTQVFIHPRTVSLNDIVAEGLGTAAGLSLWLWLSPLVPIVATSFRGGGVDAAKTLLAVYFVIYVLYALFPFDFVLNFREIGARAGRAAETMFELPQYETAAFRFFAWSVTTVAAAAPFGALLKLLDRRVTPLAMLLYGVQLGAVLELAQIFLVSATTHLLAAPLTGLGAAGGAALIGAFLAKPVWRWREAARLAAPWAALVYLLAALFAYDIVGGGWLSFDAGLAKLAELNYWPFYYHYFVTELIAVQSVVQRAALFAPVGALIWALSGAPLRVRGVAAAITTAVALCFLFETLRLFKPGLRPEYTNLWVAAASAALAAAVVPVALSWLGEAAPRVDPKLARAYRGSRAASDKDDAADDHQRSDNSDRGDVLAQQKKTEQHRQDEAQSDKRIGDRQVDGFQHKQP